MDTPDASGPPATAGRRIAIIAVHGVADQPLGDTATTLADLLTAQAPNDATYEDGRRCDVLLKVEPLAPLAPADPRQTDGAPRSDDVRGATKAAGAVAAMKADWECGFDQSLTSDFVKRRQERARARSTTGDREHAENPGVELTDYLLHKFAHDDRPQRDTHRTHPPQESETFMMPVVGLRRRRNGRTDRVDVFEMYWADLSRLAGNIPTIITELFTFLFRLSTLGRDTVDRQATSRAFAASAQWQRLSRWQTALDWMYSRLLALLFLQLIVLALLIVPLGLLIDHEAAAYGAVCALLIVGAGAWLLYRRSPPAVIAGVVIAMGALAFVVDSSPDLRVWVTGIAWLGILGVAYDAWLEVCERRFPLVRPIGRVMGVLLALGLLAFAAFAAERDLGRWLVASLRMLEIILLLIVVWWAAAAIALWVWWVAGFLARRARPEASDDLSPEVLAKQARAAVFTGRIGLTISLAFFLVLAMTGWALITTVVEKASVGVCYSPILFKYWKSGPGDASNAECLKTPGAVQRKAASSATNAIKSDTDPCDQRIGAPRYLCERYVSSTETFALCLVLVSIALAYFVLMLIPSVVAEVKLSKPDSERSGRWLTRGFRWLEPMIEGFGWLALVLASLVAVVLIGLRFESSFVAKLADAFENSQAWQPFALSSQQLLSFVVIGAGSAVVALAALGRILSRNVPWLRAPLDIALDVDNYFREFPRDAIPRARIFSRYAAVLRHVADQHYDGIVIVAHSQGTVITADLMRYLQAVAGMPPAPPALPSLWQALKGKVTVVTAGCPLRQLYAARFPFSYDWVIEAAANVCGPKATDVGALAWVNLYAVGDYVGRWLWSREAPAQYPPSQIDERVGSPSTVYEADELDTTSRSALMGAATEKDICLGAGAHTHYFDRTQAVMARTIDALACG